jgi:hypothetical protein
MHRSGFVFAFFCLLVSACGGQPALTVIPSLAASPEPTKTATFIPGTTPTPTPDSAASPHGDTSTPDTPTITPLPTIPTFTPTFDVRTIVTATPAPKAKCPKEKKSLKATFKLPISGDPSTAPKAENEILDFLNAGGSIAAVLKHVNALQYPFDGKTLASDITGDGIPELLFLDFGAITGLHIYMCSNDVYVHYSPYTIRDGSYYQVKIVAIKDMNLDGVQEVVIQKSGCSGMACNYYQVLSWNGKDFIDKSPDAEITGVENVFVKDIDHDSLVELRLIGGISLVDFAYGYPWRKEIRTYKWNGEFFVLQPLEYSAPQFRFQAVQDADRAVLAGWHDRAFESDQKVISSQDLDWWSQKRFWDTHFLLCQSCGPDTAKPASGEIDLTEYPRLAAYAYYRMVILHTHLGEMDAAQVKYATLQEKFPAGDPGHPYVEMASDFWNAYQSSGKMYNACAAAVAYADAHPEILTPLGSDYHGWQSHAYIPADVCPFR